MKTTVVLNADFTYLNTVTWKKAMKMLIKEKAEVLKEAERKIHSVSSVMYRVPLVLRLVRLVKVVYNNKVPWSRRNVFIRDNFTCQYCGTKYSKLELEHVVPVSRGGKTSFENCVASCKRCNNRKGNKTPEEVGMKLLKRPHEPTIMEFLIHKMKSTGAYDFLKEIGVY